MLEKILRWGRKEAPPESHWEKIPVVLTVMLGRAQVTLEQVKRMGEGSVVSLQELAGEPLIVLANGRPVARGEALIVDDSLGVRITDMLSPEQQQEYNMGILLMKNVSL
jgi:flagellar motor switch protein FliN